jgi:hypothetical protein
MTSGNEELVQPIDSLLTKFGISNADLVRASTEQLSFKMVQKARKGKPLSLNIHEKIVNALLKIKPELQVKRRELFHYPMDEAIVEKIKNAIALFEKKKISYPAFIDLLLEAEVNHYVFNATTNKTTFYASGSQAFLLETSPIHAITPGMLSCDVNLRQRKIVYKGQGESRREDIPVVGAEPAPIEEKVVVAPAIKKPAVKKKEARHCRQNPKSKARCV